MILATSQAGTGAPIAILHGLFGRSQNLGVVARHLARGARVISIDLRNHGASGHAAGMEYRTLAADVLETLRALDALPASLLGHSMGGKTAMAVALSAPAMISRLLVADIAPVAYAHHNAAVAAAMRNIALVPGMSRRDADRLLAEAVPDAGVRGFLLQNFIAGAAPGWRIGLDEIAAGMSDIERWPAWPEGACFNGSALFVSGARSDYVLPEYHAAIRALFPAASFSVLADAGHWLHADQPALFNAEAESFLRIAGR